MSPQAAEKLMTAEQFAAFRGDEDKAYELIQGVLVEMSKPGARHAKLQARLIFRLGGFVEEHQLGQVLGESGYRLGFNPDTVRAPDVAYLNPELAVQADEPAFLRTAPTIAIEIKSPHDAVNEAFDKAHWWLFQGSAQVWNVDPDTRTVTVYQPDHTTRVLGEDETLTADDLLPGFELPLATLFA